MVGVTARTLTLPQPSWAMALPSLSTVSMEAKALAFQVASKLTNPICAARQWHWETKVVDILHPGAYRISNVARKCLLKLGVFMAGSLACVTTLPGMLIRSVTANTETIPYIYRKGNREEKAIGDKLKIISANICAVGAGYSITDGGVVPWRQERLDRIVQRLIRHDADVACLYELLDTDAAFYLQSKLKDHFAHFYFNMGARTIGTTSGIFIASQVPLSNPEFIAFPQDAKDDRAKYSQKGFFHAKVGGIELFSTHMQHSEIPAKPTLNERQARAKEIALIMDRVREVNNPNTLIVGDLNYDPELIIQRLDNTVTQENDSPFETEFQESKEPKDPSYKTWKGDAICKRLQGEKGETISQGLNLDRALIAKTATVAMRTAFEFMGFNPEIYDPKADSDHDMLITIVNLNGRAKVD